MARMRAPINSIKHYNNIENATVASGARRSLSLIDGVNIPAAASPDDVIQGAICKAIFIEIWIKSLADAGQDTKFQLSLEIAPSGIDTISFAEMNNLMDYENKKNVLFFSQGVLGDLTTQAVPVIRQWFKIPRGKQRFGLGDRLLMAISATAFTINTCGFCTYKEYR